ncbi:hypothetical protein MJO28_005383 [Puccinia striiformis f. sp. tritici]|nr:hypothetical protein MJO28_005383 [Puccinia striiformis f. sp. tritici]KNE89883.1 hypothetical protein PSTG_16672 [Puccinia striiformis f. sp. tritici PST-78]
MLALVGLRAAEELFFCDLILGDRPRGLCVDQIIKTGKKAKHYPRRNSLFFKCDKGFDSYCCSKVTDSNVHRGSIRSRGQMRTTMSSTASMTDDIHEAFLGEKT